MSGFLAGRSPRDKGLRYPADPPKVEEIIPVMRAAGGGAHGRRLRGLIVILWRAGLRVQEALALTKAVLDPRRGSLLVRCDKGGRRREVGMDDWGWQELQPWLERRLELPSARCSASSTERPVAGPRQPRPPARNSGEPLPRPAYVGASRHTNSATPTRSRWPAKASR
jgi:integrase